MIAAADIDNFLTMVFISNGYKVIAQIYELNLFYYQISVFYFKFLVLIRMILISTWTW